MTRDELNMLDELLETDSGLTAWEMDFVESLDAHRQRALSEKQIEALERTWHKILG